MHKGRRGTTPGGPCARSDIENNLRSEIWAVHIGQALGIDTDRVEDVVREIRASVGASVTRSSTVTRSSRALPRVNAGHRVTFVRTNANAWRRSSKVMSGNAARSRGNSDLIHRVHPRRGVGRWRWQRTCLPVGTLAVVSDVGLAVPVVD